MTDVSSIANCLPLIHAMHGISWP